MYSGHMQYCDVLQRIAEAFDPAAAEWTGSELPMHPQGLKMLGTPVGRHTVLMVVARALCTGKLLDTRGGAGCFKRILREERHGVVAMSVSDHAYFCVADDDAKQTASMPMVLGGLGLLCATRNRQGAYWSSWADCLQMVHQWHPGVAGRLETHHTGSPRTTCLQAAPEAKRDLAVSRFEAPSWHALAQ